MEKTINVAFIGNPNCGKTTLFNAYTGAKLKVANWPGVTVEKKEGAFEYHDHPFKLVDLPGIYSLTSYTMEEKLSRSYILEDEVDVIVDVVDASSLERNLYLALQLIELGKPVVLALNMMDIVEERGMEIDIHRLPEMLGIPTIPVSARKKMGLDILMHAVAHHKDKSPSSFEHHHDEKKRSGHPHNHHKECVVVYSDEIEDKIDRISERLQAHYKELTNVRWLAIKLLEQDAEIRQKYTLDLTDLIDRSYETDIINQKYDFIEEVISECLVNKDEKAEATDKVDAVLTHNIWGLPIFFGIMALVFFLTFNVGDALKGIFEVGLDWFSTSVYNGLQLLGAGDVLISLIVEGIIAGVGGILTFLPNIFILFLALAFLEDSGYMSRVAYVMDGLMSKLGLSGRAFIPMLLGFGCSVPAIMASRALEDPKDRLKTILITPFMSCSARLPIYVLFSEMFFPQHAMLVAYSMYLIGVVVAVLVALALKFIGKKKQVHTLLIELPEYKAPNARTIFIYVWEKVKDYLAKAGTTIFVASIIIWVILNFGPTGMVEDMSLSFGAILGKMAVPLLSPAGLGYWQVVVALIAGIAAKEIVVSSMTVLYGIANISSQVGMSTMVGALGAVGFTALNAYSLMVFSLLYIPCAATIATIRKETNSWKWTGVAIALQLIIAWGVATLVYQIGSLII
ncbi:ferrous iron transport protein B [Sporanaerobium hydrogeniformans]|uniref:Ferrous iron transport protein B n=1 Tax=Sporanaerobium hydrogeniformans TaxID=3072179 RepID=A0AC61D6N2_9FIRM|nr:ferrous iron transport protein B [Sporanaerobium hydrogeniformans]PHV69299.1 ferrous iron transport protein B [Sporanaerobium hydrogeniformans]